MRIWTAIRTKQAIWDVGNVMDIPLNELANRTSIMAS